MPTDISDISGSAPAVPIDAPAWTDTLVLDPRTLVPDRPNYLLDETTTVSEEIFGIAGPVCHRNGWCVIPQQRTGRRLPSIYRNEAIKWGLYHDVRPEKALVHEWAEVLSNDNCAVILGPPSGYVWALDLDIKDLRFVKWVEGLAFEILGVTRFRRIGSAPKEALLYRAATPADMPANVSRTFVEEGGVDASPHAIEIQGHRKMLTIYGRHHETMNSFKWTYAAQPAMRRPEDVPAVTLAQVEHFMERVQEIRAFHRNVRTAGDGDVEFLVSDDVRTPRYNGAQDWVEKDGVVVDGREKFLFALARDTVTANPDKAGTPEGRAALMGTVASMFRSNALVDGRWVRNLDRDVQDKVVRASEALRSGTISARRDTVRRKPAPVKARPRLTSDDPASPLKWLPSWESRRLLDIPMTAADPVRAAQLVIPATAKEAGDRVAAEVRDQIGVFFRSAFDSTALTHLVLAPTGAGKTVSTIAAIVERKDRRIAAGNKIAEPILFLVPNYKNVREISDRARKAGLVVVEFRGKAKTNCVRKDDVLRLQTASRSSAGLCWAEDPTDPDGPGITCPFWAECEYQRNLAAIATADVVVAVHDYVACSLPVAMDQCVAVVIDESIYGKLIRTFRIPLETLDRPRSSARRTKKEIAAGLTHEAFDNARDEIAGVVMRDIRKGRDVARWFVDCDAAESTRRRGLLDLTISLCSRVHDNGTVTPLTPSAGIEDMCSVVERKHIVQEAKFWRVLKDRVERLLQDRLPVEMEGYEFAGTRKAMGDTDRRIHWERGATARSSGTIRVSWTAEHNFLDKPLLVLDASANVPLLETVLDRRNVVFQPITTPLRLRTVHVVDRTFSKTSILPRRGDREPMEFYKARLVVEIRNVISHIVAMHPIGGIVVCMPLALRRLVCEGWARPDRIIFMHYGDTRGQNVAEACSAAIAIGCINPSLSQIDDIVSAIAWQAEEQEPLLDPIGPYRDVEMDGGVGFEKRNADIQLRHGGRMTLSQNAVSGYYAEIVLAQIRREEHLQFIGRLRPIYRDYIPVLYNVGSYLPESIVVDEVLSWADLVDHVGNAVEVARECQGHIGKDDDAYEAELGIADGAIWTKRIAKDDGLKDSFFQIAEGGEVMFVPAHSPSLVAMLEDDGAEVVHRPALETFPDVPDPYRISWGQECAMRDEALGHAWQEGWTPRPDTREWHRDDRWVDVAVLAQVYRSRLSLAALEAVEEPAEKVAGIEVDYAEA